MEEECSASRDYFLGLASGLAAGLVSFGDGAGLDAPAGAAAAGSFFSGLGCLAGSAFFSAGFSAAGFSAAGFAVGAAGAAASAPFFRETLCSLGRFLFLMYAGTNLSAVSVFS